VASFILSVTPFIWFSISSDITSRQPEDSRLRKLIFCVVILTFVLPVMALVGTLALIIQVRRRSNIVYVSKWTNEDNSVTSATGAYQDPMVVRLLAGEISSRERIASKRSLSRTMSAGSRKSSQRRQNSGRNKRCGSARSVGYGAGRPSGGRASPQLDRHPSLRFSIKRQQSSNSISMEIGIVGGCKL